VPSWHHCTLEKYYTPIWHFRQNLAGYFTCVIVSEELPGPSRFTPCPGGNRGCAYWADSLAMICEQLLPKQGSRITGWADLLPLSSASAFPSSVPRASCR
jgi:hypothetical protein